MQGNAVKMPAMPMKKVTIAIPEATLADLKELQRRFRQDGIVFSEADILRHAIRKQIRAALSDPNNRPLQS
jgi:hypothetical protein